MSEKMDICDRHKFPSPFAMAVIALAGITWAGIALAQIPDAFKLPGSGQLAASAPAGTTFDPEKLRGSIEAQRSQVRERLARASAGNEPPVPTGISPDEIENARKAIPFLEQVYGGQLDALVQIEKLTKAHEAAERAADTWPGFKEKPPYSILLWDDVREEKQNYQNDLTQLKASQAVASVENFKFRDRVGQAREAVRRATEVRDRASPGTDAYALASWRLDASRDSAMVAEALVATFSLASRELEEKIAISQTYLRLAERKLSELSGKIKISKADLAEAHRRLDVARAQREKQLRSLIAARVRYEREREKAHEALEALQKESPSTTSSTGHARRIEIAEARLRAADAWLRNLTYQIRTLTILTTLYYQDIRNAWDLRYAVLAGDDADARQRTKQRLDETITYLQGWEVGIKSQRIQVRTLLPRQSDYARSAADPEVEKYEREAHEALQQLDLALDQQANLLGRRLTRLGFWQEEFTEALKERSPGEIARDVLARVKVIATAFWNYELLTIEDTVEIGGQKVTTTRGVTIGKSVGAILLFMIGWWMMRFLSLRMERMLVHRFGIEAQQGRTLRRWAEVLAVLVLALLTLNIARIPLTVFAFAGGALAIGIGFGTQTLIKNLISGMIVLVERQIKVGDIVEVEGVTGWVTEVNIRSSTVRGFDGVESMIPNAMLLEQRVTNWTLSNSNLRRIVRVGVAYGSPIRDVAKVLADCADRHGLVLKNPEPRVIFEDFGDNALVFALYFWINLTPDTNSLQVMSDLRFMIEKQLGEAGVVIAYPQRDVHLDTSSPLQIEVVRPIGARAAEK